MMLDKNRKNDCGRNYQEGQSFQEFGDTNFLAVHYSEECGLDEHA